MAKCMKCGRFCLNSQLDGMGRCDECSAQARKEREHDRNLETRRKNYIACMRGDAKPEYQRIYNAFHAKYPDALIEGISVYPTGNRITVYLQGGVTYDVTFNPLTNTVDVVNPDSPKPSTITPQKQTVKPEDYEEKPEGCLMIILKSIGCVIGVIVLLYIASIVIYVLFGDSSSSTSTPKASPTATAPADDTLAWTTYYASLNLPDDISLVEVYPNDNGTGEHILVIHYFMDPMREGEDYIIAAAKTIIEVGELIRSNNLHEGYDSINFLFYGGFRDKYGTYKESIGIRAWYSAEEFELLNFDYFEDYLYSRPSQIIKASDDYIIHSAYLD